MNPSQLQTGEREQRRAEFDNSPDYWLKTSELIRHVPHVAGFATEAWKNVEPTQENYNAFTKYIKDVAYQQAEFLSFLADTQPDSPLLIGLKDKYDLDIEYIKRVYIDEKEKRERRNEEATINELVPVLADLGIPSDSLEHLEFMNFFHNARSITLKGSIDYLYKKAQGAIDFYNSPEMARAITILVALGGLGADWLSSSYWSLDKLMIDFNTKGFSTGEVNSLIIGTTLTLAEVFAMTLILRQAPLLWKKGKRLHAFGAGAIGAIIGVATLPSYFLTLNFINSMITGYPDKTYNLVSIVYGSAGAEWSKFIIGSFQHTLTFLTNYGSDVIFAVSNAFFPNENKSDGGGGDQKGEGKENEKKGEGTIKK
jgi:hypothetical protein